MLSQIFWHARGMLPLVVALGVMLVVAVLWLYPSQVRQVAWPWRWVLPALRVTGLLVLTATLLQPAALRLRRAEERAAVLMLVDRSRSMSVTDVGRDPAQLVALADGLGRLPAGARPAATATLSSDLGRLRARVADVTSAANDVETAQAFGRGIEAARDRLAAAQAGFAAAASSLAARSESAPAEGELRTRLAALKDVPAGDGRTVWAASALGAIDAAVTAAAAFQGQADRALYETNAEAKAACDELAKLSRWALAEQALLRPGSGMVPQVVASMPVVAYAVSDTVSPIALARGDDVKATLPTEPTALGSNIAGAVSAALASAAGRPVRAVVLLSDGRQVGGEGAVVSGLAPAGVPVFAVGVAPPGAAHDLAFGTDVSVNDSAFIGETVTVRATLTATGLPLGATDVQLRAGEAVQSQRVEVKPGVPARVEFPLRLERGGPQKIVLTVPGVAGEVTVENNTVERWVKVLPERMRVAAFAGSVGRDFQFLRNALARTPWIQLESGVLDPVQPALPMAPADLLRQNVLILSDVSAAALSDVQWDAVNELVRSRGGSLFLLAGPHHLPSTYTPQAIVASGLLPYDPKTFSPTWREWPGGDATFRLLPSPRADSAQLEALRLVDGTDNTRHWQSLPGAFRYLPIPELNANLNTRPLLVEADSRMPVLTESRPGSGRVFFLGADETWRWRFKTGERDFDRFWLQLVRYAAGEPFAVQRELIALDVNRVAPAPGQPVDVRARILVDNAEAYRLEVLRAGGAPEQVQALRPADGGKGGLYVATVAGLPEGDYVVRLTRPGEADPAATLEVPLHVAASAEAEMADVSGDDGVLRRLAESSGGEFLTLDRLGELQSLLARTSEKRSQYFELPLWDSPFLFLFVVACFGGEWALRKRFGLA